MKQYFGRLIACSLFAVTSLACLGDDVALAMDEKAMLASSLDRSYFRHCDQYIGVGGRGEQKVAYSDTIVAREMRGVLSGRNLLSLKEYSERIFSGDNRHAAIEQAIASFKKNDEGFRYTMGKGLMDGSWHFCAVGEKGTVVTLPR